MVCLSLQRKSCQLYSLGKVQTTRKIITLRLTHLMAQKNINNRAQTIQLQQKRQIRKRKTKIHRNLHQPWFQCAQSNNHHTQKNTTNNVPIYKSPAKQLSESKVSVSTVDSETFRAPGLYNPKEESKVKNGQFSKDGRFKVQKQVYQDTPLLVNESQTRKRPPMSTVMKPKTSKTKHLISKQQQE